MRIITVSQRQKEGEGGTIFLFFAFSHKTCNELHPISPTISCLLFCGRPLVQILATAAPRPVIVTNLFNFFKKNRPVVQIFFIKKIN